MKFTGLLLSPNFTSNLFDFVVVCLAAKMLTLHSLGHGLIGYLVYCNARFCQIMQPLPGAISRHQISM